MDVCVEILPPNEQLLPNGMAAYEITVPELNVRQYLHLPFDDFHRHFGAPEGLAADLLVWAGIVYLVDQLVARSLFPDNWTRDLSLTIPVDNPTLWNEVANSLAGLLQLLTGDVWRLSFASRNLPIYHHRQRQLRPKPLGVTSTVCLFSGGLDSLVGALDHLEGDGDPITLVGHYDSGSIAKKAQSSLATSLEEQGQWPIDLIQARVGAVGQIADHPGVFGRIRNPARKESTFRSRSIVFLALGLYVAQQHGADASLLIPENGFIAFNPPLTDARLGSCSTKTAHPFFLQEFQELVRRLGIANPIHNPLLAKAKGAVLRHAASPTLVRELVPETVSCAHPTRRQGWHRRDVTHCGYCVPCLFRRAGLHQVGIDNGSDYGLDVWAGELGLSELIADDLRAVLSWVYNAHYGRRTSAHIVNRMRLTSDLASMAVEVVESGLTEMTQIIAEKADARIKKWAGLEDL